MSEAVRAEAFKARLQPNAEGCRRLVTAPGCWDAFSALLIEQAGFEAAFLTGGGLSMARLGRPDIGLVTMNEVAETVALIRDRVDLPLIVDADTGFGNALNVQRTVRSFERAGATVIQLEDQSFPKRCGQMAGKALVSTAEAVGKIRAALDARDHVLISARTDAVSVDGIEAALDRAEAYLEAGADWVFVEGPRTMVETQAVAARFAARVPLVHNLVEGVASATKEGAVLEGLGFAVALHPLVLLHGFARQAPEWLARLKATRSTATLENLIADLSHMNAVTGLAQTSELGRVYQGIEP